MGGRIPRVYSWGIPLFLALALLALTLPSRALGATIQLKASLNAAQEVLPVTSTGTGAATATLDTLTGQLAGNLTFSGLTTLATATTIHGPAAPGVNAPVITLLPNFPLATSGSYDLSMAPPLTPLQVSEMRVGLCYLNLHTTNFPLGEIRGQLTLIPHFIPIFELLLFD